MRKRSTLVEALADAAGLNLSVISRRLKGEIEFREKLSAFLVIIAGGASFSSLGPIWNSLTNGRPDPWLIIPTAGGSDDHNFASDVIHCSKN